MSPLPVIPAVKGADYVGMETCALCHQGKVRDFRYTAHADYYVRAGEQETVICERCHGAGSLHVEAGGGIGQYIINPDKNPDTCFQCHLNVQAEFHLQYHHPLRQERISCGACHNPHGKDIFAPKDAPVFRENELCFKCHREQAVPRVFEHEALREGCRMCHRVHGSINDKMLMENDNNLCLKCHGQIAAPGTLVIGDSDHTARVMQGTCWSAGCHTAIHGSNINPHLRY